MYLLLHLATHIPFILGFHHGRDAAGTLFAKGAPMSKVRTIDLPTSGVYPPPESITSRLGAILTDSTPPLPRAVKFFESQCTPSASHPSDDVMDSIDPSWADDNELEA